MPSLGLDDGANDEKPSCDLFSVVGTAVGQLLGEAECAFSIGGLVEEKLKLVDGDKEGS